MVEYCNEHTEVKEVFKHVALCCPLRKRSWLWQVGRSFAARVENLGFEQVELGTKCENLRC